MVSMVCLNGNVKSPLSGFSSRVCKFFWIFIGGQVGRRVLLFKWQFFPVLFLMPEVNCYLLILSVGEGKKENSDGFVKTDFT